MPFNGGYVDFDKPRRLDARGFFAAIAKKIIRDPISTHVIKTRTRSGKTRFLVVDRAREPREGDYALIACDGGLRLGRIKRPVPMKYIWGTVVWFLQEG